MRDFILLASYDYPSLEISIPIDNIEVISENRECTDIAFMSNHGCHARVNESAKEITKRINKIQSLHRGIFEVN
jgi:hypothetical protein